MSDLNDMVFGVPNLRKKVEEKYPNNAVLTFEPTGKGLGNKGIFNGKALADLGLSETKDQISFSFTNGEVFVANTSGTEQGKNGLKIGKTTDGFADKKHYIAIKSKNFGIADTEELEVELIPTENKYNGFPVFRLVKMTQSSKVESTSSQDMPVAADGYSTSEDTTGAAEPAGQDLSDTTTDTFTENLENEEQAFTEEIPEEEFMTTETVQDFDYES